MHKLDFSEANLDLKVKVANVASVRLHAEHSIHFVPLFASKVVVEVENCLLPVSVPGLPGISNVRSI